MQVEIAKKAGFCTGVKRAVAIAGEYGGKNQVYTLGPLVHNQAVIHHFRTQGIEPVQNLDELTGNTDSVLIIRSHGVAPEVFDEAKKRGIFIEDATCPRVKRVHELVASMAEKGYEIAIFGDPNHPEVKGILGWSRGRGKVVGSPEEASQLAGTRKLAVVSQTTRSEKDYLAVINAMLPGTGEMRVFNTLCAATRERQEAARELAAGVDLMLVIGDPTSSNSNTLYKECVNTGVPVFWVQNADDIEPDWLKGVSRVGITAGASTPDWIIKEVMDRMTAFEESNQEQNQGTLEQEVNSTEESFAEMEAEMADFPTPSRGDVIKGKVIEVRDDEVMVDVGGKSEGIIPLRELSMKDLDSAREIVEVGDEIEVLVLKWDDDGTILLSKKKVDSKKMLDQLEEDFNQDRLVEGTVTGSVKGGLLVDVGVVAFLPASHVEDGYVRNLDEYIGKTFQFKILEFNRNKRRGSQIVVSRKELVAQEKARKKEEFWSGIEEGQTRKGEVKRIVDYGAFIDLGGYEGLLHVSELDHRRVEHPSDILHEGQELDVYVLGLDREKERVSLSRKKLLKSPWEIVLEQCHEGDIIEGTVVRLAPFGAFVELEPGVDGLVHISQLADRRVEKPEDVVQVGEQIKVKILKMDPEAKRIGLSIREAQKEAEQQEVDEFIQNQE
ncbi:bifunctional 4-hydroxy-3-methylbut-2-enyl diphosphate reductase/30S ribosomal protein S1 [Syntrophomonas erecta]